MPINLTNISANQPVIYAPNWFDSKITGKGKTRGLLCIDKNPNMLPADTPEAFSLPRTNRKRTMRNGNIEISVFPMNIYADDSYNILKTLPIPDRKLMCLAATNSKNTIYFNIAAEVSIVIHTALSSFFMEEIVPVPSTCPATICPPNLPFAAIALSRLTLLPLFNSPRFVRLNVSCITSTE